MTSPMISCNALFSFFKPSSNAAAQASHRDTKTRKTVFGRNADVLVGISPQSNDAAATPPNPVRQNARPMLALAGFKSVLKAIKYQKMLAFLTLPQGVGPSSFHRLGV
jgi:hypothetical protein